MLIDVKCSSNTFGNIDNNASNTGALAFEAVDVLMVKEEIPEIANKLYTNTNTSIRQSSVPTKESANVMSNDEQPERLPASGSPKAKIIFTELFPHNSFTSPCFLTTPPADPSPHSFALAVLTRQRRSEASLTIGRAKRLRSGRVIGRQWEFLVDYMVRHPALATGKLMGPRGAINATQQWTKLSQQLNELGPKKSTNQWKKVWRDLKRNTKARAATVNAVLKQTDNLNVEDKLTALDKKVIAVIGWESNTGIPEPSTAETDNELEDDRVRPTPCNHRECSNSHSAMPTTRQFTNSHGAMPTTRQFTNSHGAMPTTRQFTNSHGAMPTTRQFTNSHGAMPTTRQFTNSHGAMPTTRAIKYSKKHHKTYTTAEQMTVLGTAFTKIATATDRMATAIEIMSTAITKLAESIANKDLVDHSL
uniref:Regulatory protein zeste n=1 Tax=Timema shepardi TaxID=629360 RepID=A0A7R9G161_TIMSH|nr:unnamed protein product [Timema shepardi]